ncbi:MAG: hypothetical protein ACYTGH_21260 [Planctomycetota bacterium]|jgi:hypothetical protein
MPLAYNDNTEAIYRIIQELEDRILRSKPLLEAEVDGLIARGCTDQKEIERLLDSLLDLCFHDEMLPLYKRLCRYTLPLNPKATADYVQFYREMYEEA